MPNHQLKSLKFKPFYPDITLQRIKKEKLCLSKEIRRSLREFTNGKSRGAVSNRGTLSRGFRTYIGGMESCSTVAEVHGSEFSGWRERSRSTCRAYARRISMRTIPRSERKSFAPRDARGTVRMAEQRRGRAERARRE